MTEQPKHAHGIGAVRPVGWVYARSPMIVYWELTNACGLACRHCRATAMPDPAPGELSTDQALALLDDIAGFGDPLPHIVFTGGDPLRRHDLDLLLAEAGARGIGVSLAPAVTPLLTRERLVEVKQAGVQAISLSLDGSCPALHDGVRGVAGTFDATLEALGWAEELGIPVQINTLVTDTTAADLPAVYDLLSTRKLMRWSLFFLISIGRGTQLTELAPEKAEQLMTWLGNLNRTAPFQVKTTEAMQYRRIAARAARRRGLTDEQIEASPMARGFGIRDGNGIIFVSHLGDVTPSGFLPLALGNVKESSLVELYRDDPTLRALRDPKGFKGRCGRCEFNLWCGGSRARAYAWTGDVLESDPLCPYVPSGTPVNA
ncbi:radical SAM protein [Brooklawnia cerclae]|uniref:Radical SAM protein n=1 Tax=Brooklawnia cerclae TaxID=349934 RepID=A0ABX0SBW7_9ACTN|nr:TIGR04053 family radical SAM/SPASM domain-containing protein [Brooklawnia cerclae]NIH55525.1 radical SAM protein [Brooklawnia cerclae]